MCENCNSKTWNGEWSGSKIIICEHDWEWIDMTMKYAEYKCTKCGFVKRLFSPSPSLEI